MKATTTTSDPIERAMGVYRGMTEAEREQVFRNLAGAVAGFAETRNAEALATFADSMALTIRMRLIPGYQDRVHASQTRQVTYEDALDAHEVISR